MHEVYKKKKDRAGSGSDFVFLDGEGKRRREQYRYIGGRRRGGGRINRIAARREAAGEELKEFLDFSWARDRGEAL